MEDSINQERAEETRCAEIKWEVYIMLLWCVLKKSRYFSQHTVFFSTATNGCYVKQRVVCCCDISPPVVKCLFLRFIIRDSKTTRHIFQSKCNLKHETDLEQTFEPPLICAVMTLVL